ncbi:Mu transposase C-terminal domain-containing protein [Pseudomonas aeruginosa]|uniref:Mu transposase C-terminal domain-containing protein n=1 Tax=Pseudomonas aeruginosa TaxID=287 RepID=UPI0009A27315|nr:Mu transposase C-terminal domain-containing protein [Pseudomonas aeruginosa]MBH3771393.1 DDE-type integrase/transposase/recombinase [Pseudomonas aeruginosa]
MENIVNGKIIRNDRYFSVVNSERELLASDEAQYRFSVASRFLSKEISLKKAIGLLGCGKSTFYRLLKKYDDQLGPAALLKSRRGRKQGVRCLDERIEEIIARAISDEYRKRASSYAKVWREVKARCAKEGLSPPSQGTVTSRIKSLEPRFLHRIKHGAKSASDRYGAKPGKVNLRRPLELTQIDHTLVDVILCDDINREPIGRPWLTVLIDVWSRVILSYYLALHAPSALSVAATMAFAVADKRNYLKLIGCEDIKYPFSGKPEVVHADNAKEFRSNTLVRACDRNRIKMQWRPVGRKHYGGHVERLIGTLMRRVHFLPGTTFSNTNMRKDYESEKQAVMTFGEFIAWFAREVFDYHATPHSSLGKSPADAWSEYFKGADSGGAMSLRECELFRVDFLPEERRIIHPRGILLNWKYYYTQELQAHIGNRVVIKHDPLSIKNIWVELNGVWVKVPYSDLAQSDSSSEAERIKRLWRGEQDGWLNDEEVAKNKKKSSEIVIGATKLSKSMRKKNKAATAYSEFIGSFEVNSKEERSQEEVDYSKKPEPFPSEG